MAGEPTPGPWTCFQSNTGFFHVVGGPKQTVLADLVPRGAGAAPNARLMAAAPALLAACEAALRELLTRTARKGDAAVIAQLQAARAAARGEDKPNG